MNLHSHAAVELDGPQPARRSLRVAVVSETYPPEVNGVAATISRVVEGLYQRGHQLQLVRPRQQEDVRAGLESPAAGGQFAQVLMPGLPIPRYPQLKMGLPCKWALMRLWSARRPDVVHIVTEGLLGWSALRAALQLGLPVVSDFRTNFHAYSQHYGMTWLRGPILAYLRKFHNRAACTMVPTDGLRAELQLNGFQRLRVVSRGVDTQLFDPSRCSPALRQLWGARPDDLVVLSVGRLAPEKNLATLLSAYEAMRELAPSARLVLVGDGPERTALQQACPSAHFAGVRRGEDLAAHYASANVFLFPSMTETFGNVLPEAMASGLAVLAYDYAAAGQLVHHGENGLLAPYGDMASFFYAARRLAQSPQEASSLGAQARKSAQSLDWGRVVEAVEAEYLVAMAGHTRRPLPVLAPALPVS